MYDQHSTPLAPLAGRRLVADLPAGERPGSRFRDVGARSLSTAELLALIVDTVDSLDLARDVLAHCGDLHSLARRDAAQLAQVPGVSEALARRILAAAELGRRLAAPPAGEETYIHRPGDAAALLSDMRELEQEEMRVILISARSIVKEIVTVYIGTPFSVADRQADLFRPAIVSRAHAIILAHNHPSGDPEPSREDIVLTKESVETARMLSIGLLDHIIIGSQGYCSIAEKFGIQHRTWNGGPQQ